MTSGPHPTRRLALLALAATMPATSFAEDITTGDGAGFDGTLYEVGFSSAYSGVFNTTEFRNFARQAGTRHFITVLQFDLSGASITAENVTNVTLTMTSNSAASAGTRTLAVFNGDDSQITTASLYDAANPLIDDAYLPEADTDVDWKEGAITDLLTYTNSIGDGSMDVVGADNADLLAAAKAALEGDGLITLVIYGGNQYATYADDNADATRWPKLSLLGDSDGDGLPDGWETDNGLDPNDDGTVDENNGADGDPDSDGATNLEEYTAGSDPQNPLSFPGDVDADGLSDLWEDRYFGNNDGIASAAELAAQDGLGDPDNDLVTNEDEESGMPVASDPNNPNSVPGNADADTLDDDWELDYFFDIFGQNGLQDSDGDLYSNEEEETLGTDPTDIYSFPEDTDDDGYNDRWELLYFKNLTTAENFDDDSDGDGLWTDDDEYFGGSDPTNAASTPDDIDGDGLDDAGFEIPFFGNIWDFDGDDDPDRDYGTNEQEENDFTSPTVRSDTVDVDNGGAGDGLGDYWEMFSFGDLTTTELPSDDNEPDGFDNAAEFAASSNGNDPLSSPDADGDGLPDSYETAVWGDPATQSGSDDSDSGGTSNLLEYHAGTDPDDGGDDLSPGIVSTAIGVGADAYLNNDDADANSGPDTVHGTDAGLQLRQGSVRLRFPILRFDVSGISGDLNKAMLRLNLTTAPRTRTISVYGLMDEHEGESWDETTVSYNNAPGIEHLAPTELYSFVRVPKQLRLIGTLQLVQNSTGIFLSNPDTLDLKSFIEADTDGQITLILHGDTGNTTFTITSREGAATDGTPELAPSLVLPLASVAVPTNPVISSATFDPATNTFTMSVNGLGAGQTYHVESSDSLDGFGPVSGSTFTADEDPETVNVTADEETDPRRFFRIADGPEAP